MFNWKIVSKIAMFSAIIILVFSAIAAFATYELIVIQYPPNVPVSFIEVSVLYAMLPYLLFAIIAFIISVVSSRAVGENTEKNGMPERQPEPQLTEVQPEATSS
jgi:TRAP-type C4-dicarboxylate transport system permease small subunit